MSVECSSCNGCQGSEYSKGSRKRVGSLTNRLPRRAVPGTFTCSHKPRTILELVSKIPQHDFHTSESDHSQEILDMVLVACDQSAKHLQPREQALHGPASP